jgi:hypothetical protein
MLRNQGRETLCTLLELETQRQRVREESRRVAEMETRSETPTSRRADIHQNSLMSTFRVAVPDLPVSENLRFEDALAVQNMETQRQGVRDGSRRMSNIETRPETPNSGGPVESQTRLMSRFRLGPQNISSPTVRGSAQNITPRTEPAPVRSTSGLRVAQNNSTPTRGQRWAVSCSSYSQNNTNQYKSSIRRRRAHSRLQCERTPRFAHQTGARIEIS